MKDVVNNIVNQIANDPSAFAGLMLISFIPIGATHGGDDCGNMPE